MKILLIDCGGNFLDFALRCKQWGHEVKWFIAPDKNGNRIPIGDGLVERVNDWQKWMRWSELTVLSDNTRYIQALEGYRKYGYPIFGANLAGQAMELDRSVGQKVFKDAGIDTLPYKTFNDYDSAEAYVRKTMGRFVSKPSADVDKALSYVSKSPQDMIYMLRRWKKLGKAKAPFILQEFCPGVEMAVGGWFGPGGWNHAINENWEHKKLMNGDKGVNTGEMGTVLRYVDKSKLADKVLFPVTDYLFKIGYTGFIDVAVIIDESGTPYPMEFTARFGWPHFQIATALHQGDPAAWMADLLAGYDSLEVSKDIATGVVCAIPDFPYNKVPREDTTGIPIYSDMNENIHPCEVMAGTVPIQAGGKVVDMPGWVTAGSYLLVATGTASSVSASAKKAYDVLKGIEIPNSPMYRTDIGERIKKELPILQSLGYAQGMTY
jgi:phosphoribosylamine--glycine ligase